MSEIWVVLAYHEASQQEYNGELLGELAAFARRQPEPPTLCAVLLAPPDVEPAALLPASTRGVERLYHIMHPSFAHYETEAYVEALVWLMQRSTPRLIAASATPDGRDWAPRLAAQLRLPFIPGCLSFDLQDDALLALRSLYEGRAYAQTQTKLYRRTALITFVPGLRGVPTQTSMLASATAPLEITRYTPEIEVDRWHGRIRHIALQPPSPEEVALDVAERIVAGGRGVGQQGFATIAAFAQKLGAAVGATRVATDLGWIEHTRQIGTTGKTVRPQLYLACGISGAAQHTSGMSEAQTVVAINPDRSAPIFALADLGLLGDANQILPLAAQMLDEPPQ